MHVFVTVGTTEFNELIEAMCSKLVIDRLVRNGHMKSMTLQIGNGRFEPPVQSMLSSSSSSSAAAHMEPRLKIEFFRLKPTISEEMAKADLIISHAGAGSLFEALGRHRKKVIAVVNETLMDNHQRELAEVLDREGNLVMTTYDGLSQLFDSPEFFTNRLSNLRPLPEPATPQFARLVDSEMGFL